MLIIYTRRNKALRNFDHKGYLKTRNVPKHKKTHPKTRTKLES